MKTKVLDLNRGNIVFIGLVIIEPLARSISLLISGRAGEYFGRKQLYIWSVGDFPLSIAISAGASSGTIFLLARGASGFFWGLFFANVFTMINDIMSEEEYPVRIGIMQTVFSLTLILGSVFCGIFTGRWNWRISLVILSTSIIGIGVGIYQVAPFAFAQRHLDDKLIAEGISFISFVQGIGGVSAGIIYSSTIKSGIAFSLAFTVVCSVTLILIIILKYKETQAN